jgi:large subunit ribosomal protein L2
VRLIDFKREITASPAPSRAVGRSNRSSASLIHYADGEKRYIIQPIGLTVAVDHK